MTTNIFKSEKDAIAFLGLMSHMYMTFDEQYIAPDKEKTHSKGLNIHALLIDNPKGQILGMQKNNIHLYNNPLLHAEQLTLKEGIDKKNSITPRDTSTTSVESYYRNFLFNDPNSYDAMKSGATIYTTLEPCPFCTCALLVSRVKRIVYVTPDSVYGNSFYSLWSTYYKKYDIHYEQMKIESAIGSDIVSKTIEFLKIISEKIAQMKGIPGTVYFDSLKDELKIISEYFKNLSVKNLISRDEELKLNSTLLNETQNRVFSNS